LVPNRDDKEAYPHLSIAFNAFCKSSRDEILTDAETEALSYCDRYGLHYILPAVFSLRSPFASHNYYLSAPPDCLHTINGGFLKDWIFHTYVIVSEVGKRHGGYADNLNVLNTKLRAFPVQQAGGLVSMKRFDKGVTPYVTSRSGELSSAALPSQTYTLTVTPHTFFFLLTTHTYTFRAGRQSRFDWLTIGQGTQHIRFIIVTYSLPYLTYTLFTLTCTFKLNVGDNKRDTTEQLIGLFVLVRRDRDPVFFYMSIKTKVVSMGTNSVVPLPQCKSSLTYTLLSNIYTFTNHTYVFSTVHW